MLPQSSAGNEQENTERERSQRQDGSYGVILTDKLRLLDTKRSRRNLGKVCEKTNSPPNHCFELIAFLFESLQLLLALQLLRQPRVQSSQVPHHLLMLSLHTLVLRLQTLDNLEDERILVIEVLHDMTNLLFAFCIGNIVVLRGESILLSLAILRHHDEWGCISCLERKSKIQEYKRIGIPMPYPRDTIQNQPCCEDNTLCDDKWPTANGRSNAICDLLSYGQLSLNGLVHINYRRMVMFKFWKTEVFEVEQFVCMNVLVRLVLREGLRTGSDIHDVSPCLRARAISSRGAWR